MDERINEQKMYMDHVREFNKNKQLKYKIKTFGCQMNENDSEKISGLLESMGYVSSEGEDDYDLVVYNTCCVRESAENKIYGHLGLEKKLKELNPDMIIIVCGCMMQQDEVVSKLKKSYRHVDIVFGTQNLHRLPALLYQYLNNSKGLYEITNYTEDVVEHIPVKRTSTIEAFVPIMYGCDNFCSYCIVPYVRGREKSRLVKDILEEVKELSQGGTREITLLGQNVNSYGKTSKENVDFPDLLYRVSEVEGIERIRFMTSHPKDISDKLIKAIWELDKVCNHLHLPLQSGSTKVLKEMNRNYTKEQYIDILIKAKEIIPDLGLSTDIIVGFPGETEEDFEDTMDVLEKVRFDFAYTFIYSKRKGTPAADREDSVTEEVKSLRFDRLVKRQSEITLENNLKAVGKVMDVLVTGPSKTDILTLTGRTHSNKIVNFKGDSSLIGKITKVIIKEAKTWHLEGEHI